MKKNKKIVVTGASGMTGAALVLRLASEGNNVVAYSRGKAAFYDSHPNISWCPGDVKDPAMLAEAMVGAEEVYHLAAIANHWAPDLRDFYRTNVHGTINVIEAAKAAKVRRVVITSSVGVVGPCDQDKVAPITEENVRLINFFNDYEASKAMMHDRVKDYVINGMDIVLVLPSRIWGPAPIDVKNSVMYFLHQYFNRKSVLIPGDGNIIGNFVHVDDVVEGHILAMRLGKAGESYFLGGQDLTMNQIADSFQRLDDRKAKVLHIPFPLIRALASVEALLAKWFNRSPISTQTSITRLGMHCPVSSEKAIRELGYSPMPYEQALDIGWKWFVSGKLEWPVAPAFRKAPDAEMITAGSAR